VERRCRFCFLAGLVATYAKVGTTQWCLSLGFASNHTERAGSVLVARPAPLTQLAGAAESLAACSVIYKI
jgi:hypothetical protein